MAHDDPGFGSDEGRQARFVKLRINKCQINIRDWQGNISIFYILFKLGWGKGRGKLDAFCFATVKLT